MQTKITFKRLGGLFTKSLTVLIMSLFVSAAAFAQPYINGPLSTGATATGGTAAPAGYTWSELQGTNTSLGAAASITFTGFKVADDFVVPAGQTWNLSSMVFYGYQTGYTNTTVSPFTTVRVTIHSGTVTGPVVFGDQTTNRFASSANANMYRIGNATPGTTRIVWGITANTVVSLPAGTYWVEYATDVTGGGGHFLPLKTVVGSATQTGNNAQQWTGTAWTALTDAGSATAQDMPFQINYVATGNPCSGTPAPGNTIATATTVCPNTPFTLSVQNATTGLGVTYQWQSGTSATGPWTNIAGATNATYTVANLTATTFYHLLVTCSNSSSTGTSNAVSVAATPASGCYCIPATSDCTDGDVITNVKFGALNNSSTCSGSGYTNYTTNASITIPDGIIGATNPITVTAGDGTYTESVGVWIDYNHSGTFEASEYTLIGTAANPTVRNGNIVIPATALTGNTRMRVRVQFSSPITGTGACSTSYLGFGETEDYTVNLVPCTPVSLTTQPAAATISCGGNATFSVVATGSLPTYQWQYRTSATGNWLLLANGGVYSGATTNTLNITNAPVSMNGYQYRVIFTGACNGPDFSNAVTLTVNPFTLAVTPASGSLCVGGAPILLTVPNNTVVSNFTNSTTGTIPDNSTTGLIRDIAVSGVTGGILSARITFNIPHTWVGDLAIALKAPNGKVMAMDYYLTGTGGAGATTGFVNTVLSSTLTTPLLGSGGSPTWTNTYAADGVLAATIGLTDAGPSGYTPNTNSWADMFVGGVNGTWSIGMIDGGAGDVGTFTNATLSFTSGSAPATAVFSPVTGLYTNAAGTTPYTGTAVTQVYAAPATTTTYSAVLSTATCTTAPQSIVITVASPASAVSAVADKAVCPAGSTTFTGTITGGTAVTQRWEVSTDGGATYTTVANGGVYSGATTTTLTLTNIPASLNGNKYRLVAVSAPCVATVASTPGTLTVNPNPVVVLGAGPTTAVYPGITTSLTAAVSPNAAASYVWSLNGAVISGQSTNTISGITVDRIGTYTVRVVDVNGCAGTSNAVTITDSATSRLFVYPNPTNNGQFHVRFYDAPGGSNFLGKRTLTIFDNKGSKVLTKEFTGVSPYTDMFIDLKNYSRGIYGIDVLDAKGNRLKTGQVVIQ